LREDNSIAQLHQRNGSRYASEKCGALWLIMEAQLCIKCRALIVMHNLPDLRSGFLIVEPGAVQPFCDAAYRLAE
jgi:hypothetical protein